MSYDNGYSVKKAFGLALGVVATIILALASFMTLEIVDADEIMVVQSPMGKLTWYTSPGPKWQGFGKITKYKKRDQYWFTEASGQTHDSKPLRIRFNDGAHAAISGSIAWEMPIDEQHLTEIHTRYRSHDSVEKQLIGPIIEKSVYMTGPLMSSAESYAVRRNELLSYIEDQILRGVYKTDIKNVRVKDPLTGSEKTSQMVELVKGENGLFLRETDSPLGTFGIKAFNLSINEVKYDPVVEQQIQSQQQAIMEVQTAIAKAKTAEQNVITAQKEGEAAAAKEKWLKEVSKAGAVVEAEQKLEVTALAAMALKTNAVIEAMKELEVAILNLEAAQKKKETDIALGVGEASRRRAIMEADGALEKKLTAYIEVNRMYAEAIKEHKGSWVPSVVMGGGQGSQGSGPADLISLLTAKTARDLLLDLRPDVPSVPSVSAAK